MTETAFPKICGLCGEDCSQKPRIKDPEGQYFCRECYEEALERQRARHELEDSPVEPVGLGPDYEPDLEADLEADLDAVSPEELDREFGLEEADDEPAPGLACPGCGRALEPDAAICINCGYSAQTGGKVKVKKRTMSLAWPSATEGVGAMLLTPMAVGIGLMALYGLLFVVSLMIPDMGVLFLGVQTVFGLAIGITVLVFAFMTGIGQGFLTLCVPFYVLYFVFSVCDNQYVRWLFGANLLGWIGSMYIQYQLFASANAF
ncbi:MAG: hypothetical protein ACYSU7_08395 [Planctomycetota bacterium]|jgi:hypothetical protein